MGKQQMPIAALDIAAPDRPALRIGVVGTGFVARRFVQLVRGKLPGLAVTGVLSRRPRAASPWIDEDLHTSSLAELADGCDVVFEASGDAFFATEICLEMVKRGMPVVTMNCEFQITTGSYFADRIFLSESPGDQPGNAAALHADAIQMGFTPLAHVNYKGFLNHNPSREDMAYWSAKQGLRLEQVVSFTDGSKLQIEQAVTANGLGLDIACEGLIGGQRDTGFALDAYGEAAEALGRPIADFAQAKNAPPGIALVARHDYAEETPDYIAFDKIATPGRKYLVLQTGYHLVHLEAPRLFLQLAGLPRSLWRPLINNSAEPRIGVAAVAKRRLAVGDRIERGLGGFDVRGVAVRMRERVDHVPLCLLENCAMRRAVDPGEVVTFDDVDLPASAAVEVYQRLRERIAAAPAATE